MCLLAVATQAALAHCRSSVLAKRGHSSNAMQSNALQAERVQRRAVYTPTASSHQLTPAHISSHQLTAGSGLDTPHLSARSSGASRAHSVRQKPSLMHTTLRSAVTCWRALAALMRCARMR